MAAAEEESSEARALREQAEAAEAKLRAALEEQERQAKEAADGKKDPLSEEDYARIAIAAMMIPSITSEESSDEGKPDEDKPEDPFHIASIAAVAAIHDPSSVPVPVAVVEDGEDLTGEDEARISIAAMMGLEPTPLFDEEWVESVDKALLISDFILRMKTLKGLYRNIFSITTKGLSTIATIKDNGFLFRIESPFRTEQRYWQESSNEEEYNKISKHASEISLDNYNFNYILKNDKNELNLDFLIFLNKII